MQTRFTTEQLQDPAIAASEEILRKCVHCGFCTATCPTYVLLGDELDSPRGRIYLIKDMLEQNRPATADVVRHLDRCLSCLSCMTTCPSGVHYQHLIDHARIHVERTYRRPFADRLLRRLLAVVLPHPGRFRLALGLAALARPLAPLLPARLGAMLRLAKRRRGTAAAVDAIATGKGAESAGPIAGTGASQAAGQSRDAGQRTRPRAAVLTGCVQSVLDPGIHAATLRLLERAGIDTLPLDGCCGALTHHLGRENDARESALALVAQLRFALERGELDYVVVNASGCGTHLKDLGYIHRDDPELAAAAAAVSAKTRDITELLAETGLPEVRDASGLRVAYHSACSMQHGQQLHAPPRSLLAAAGFELCEIAEGHLCCGSAGTYNVLQPAIAGRLKARKLANIDATGADVVATGNIGCMAQLASSSGPPIVHTVELLDWATGGPKPAALA
jgi:glycolate oxidase iron-sulfur subunit